MHLGQLQKYVFSSGGMAFGGIVVNNTKGQLGLVINRLKLETKSGVTSWDWAKLLLSDLTVFQLLLYFFLHLSSFAPFSPFLTGFH
jgi:hypothetical protein